MENILLAVKWKFALDYLDDMITFLKTPPQHIIYTYLLLSRFKEFGVVVNLKSALVHRRGKYLVH